MTDMSAGEGAMSDALALMRFLALCTSVHADALQCAVDDTQSALAQMSSEATAMTALEDAWAVLQGRQRRVAAMRAAVARARRARRDGRGDGDDSDVEQQQCDEAASCDAQVRAVEAQMRALDATSLKTRLLHLEACKRRAREVDGAAVVSRLVTSFRYSEDVEALWCDDDNNDGNDDDADDATPVLPLCACLPVTDETDVAALLLRACARFTARHADALSALVHADVDEHSDAALVHDCVLYAHALTGHDVSCSPTLTGSSSSSEDNSSSCSCSRDDVAAVLALQRQQMQTQQSDSDVATRPRVTVRARDTMRGSGGGGKAIVPAATATVLSPYESCALPMHWSTARMLAATPTSCLLPPARHLLTRRFSFADVHELRGLERLRVTVQRRLVELSLDVPRVMQSLLQQQTHTTHTTLPRALRPPLPPTSTMAAHAAAGGGVQRMSSPRIPSREVAVAMARTALYDLAAYGADGDDDAAGGSGSAAAASGLRNNNNTDTTLPRRLRRARHAWATVATVCSSGSDDDEDDEGTSASAAAAAAVSR